MRTTDDLLFRFFAEELIAETFSWRERALQGSDRDFQGAGCRNGMGSSQRRRDLCRVPVPMAT